MNALQTFLMENPVDNVTEDIVVSERLKDFPFTVRAITGGEYNSYQSLCIENPNSPKKRKFNTKKFNELVIINHTVEPNFKDADWLSKSDSSLDSAKLLYKTLLAGEISTLAEAILSLSGFDKDVEEAVEEVKN